jgi:mutator protein MutT
MIKDNRLLIAKRKANDRLGNKWEFPGGKVEYGETPEQCMKREMKEEFSIDVSVGDYLGESIYHYEHRSIRLLVYRTYWDTLPFFKLFDSSINKILKKFEVGFAYSTYSEGSMLLHGSTMEQFIHIGDSIVAPKIIPQKDFIESEFQSIIERCRMIFVYLAAIEQYILKKPELRR